MAAVSKADDTTHSVALKSAFTSTAGRLECRVTAIPGQAAEWPEDGAAAGGRVERRRGVEWSDGRGVVE